MIVVRRISHILAATICAGLLPGFEERPVLAQEALAPPLRLMNDCPDTQDTCVEMLLNLGDRLYGKFDPYRDFQQGEMDESGYGEFIIPVEGRLNGAESTTHRLFLRTYTDGINCTDFGQSHVASLGFSDAGIPILLTDQGPIEVVDSSFEIGCRYCAKLLFKDTGKVAREIITPSWGLRMVGLTEGKENHFYFNDEARVFLRNDPNGKNFHCLEIGNENPFYLSDAAQCSTNTRIIGHYGFLAEGVIDIELGGGEWLLENGNSSSYFMHVYAGACT